MVFDADNAGKGKGASFNSSGLAPAFTSYKSFSGKHAAPSASSSSALMPFMGDLNRSLDPSLSLSEKARLLQDSATTALTVVARGNPSVQRLVEAHQKWESKLRMETQVRLGRFQPEPFLRQSGLLDDDFALPSRAPKSGRPRGMLGPPGLGKSLSAGNIAEPDLASAAAHDLDSSIDVNHTMSGALQASGMSAPRRFQIHRSVTARLDANGNSSLPKTHGEMSLEQLSAVINAKAKGKLEAFLYSMQRSSKHALIQAHSSIKETATTLEGNFAMLGSILSGSSPSQHRVGWQGRDQANTSGEGALVPWGGSRKRLGCAIAEDDGKDSGWATSLDQALIKLWRKRDKKRSVREPGRQVAIVTTAALPWMTGTSINPLLRAAYLSKDAQRKVTLVIPWLSKVDQDLVFPVDVSFDTPEQQEVYVREWVRKRTGMECNFKITWYPGRYAADRGFIMPVGDITQCIPDSEADVAVLEEPEHLTWYHHGRRWSDKFNQVVGVMHTNYLDYIRREPGGAINAFMMEHFNRYVCGVHCNKVIKLSDAVQPLPREHTLFVHGVSPSFLQVGAAKSGLIEDSASDDAEAFEKGLAVVGRNRRCGQALESSSAGVASCTSEQSQAGEDGQGLVEEELTGGVRFAKGAYFLGKALWAKAYTELLGLMKEHGDRTGSHVTLDVFGHGPDVKEIESRSAEWHLGLKFNGPKDHANADLHDYKVFVNPSLSDVVATTTAEALAMGKFVVCADHPSNRFFQRYPNCLVYKSSEEFSQCLQKALSSEPKPLSPDELHSLSWEAATDRFLDAADITTKMQPLEAVAGAAMYGVMNTLLGLEAFRQAMGAGAKTRDLPCNVADYVPSQEGTRMLFDRRPVGAAAK